jgi:hypothetical protein
MFVLFTDFGLSDLYVGQMKAVLHRRAPGLPVVDLLHDVNPFDIRAATYLLPAYTTVFGDGAVFVCVVDPGVGSERGAQVVQADGQWFVGPDNGLFSVLQHRATEVQCWTLDWRPADVSSTFHGRDVFSPVAAELAMGRMPAMTHVPANRSLPEGWTAELDAIVYVDDFGNCITGRRAESLHRDSRLSVNGRELAWARTFSDVPEGQAFWYENANGLVEIAVNQGGADDMLSLDVGSVIEVLQAG